MCFGEAIDYKLWIVQPCRQDASGISRAQLTHLFLCPPSPVPSFTASQVTLRLRTGRYKERLQAESQVPALGVFLSLFELWMFST